jgi:hypothetical protein
VRDGPATAKGMGKGNHEGAVVSSENVHQVQNSQAQRRGARDLRKPQAQATTGVGLDFRALEEGRRDV